MIPLSNYLKDYKGREEVIKVKMVIAKLKETVEDVYLNRVLVSVSML